MQAQATFSTRNFTPAGLVPTLEVKTGLPVSVSTMEKSYSGAIDGVSSTLFTAAFDPATRRGSYIAMESFKGSIDGKAGSFNFIHSASTTGTDRADEFFRIVAGSGTDALQGIRGSGGMKVEADGTYRVWLDYELV